jgi:hypothetical protein
MLTKAPDPELQDVCIVDGRRLRHLTARQRATLAAGLVTGSQRTRLTRKQASTICRVPSPLLAQAMNGKPSNRLEPRAILVWWQSASFAERVALIHAFGPGPTWDALSAVVDD